MPAFVIFLILQGIHAEKYLKLRISEVLWEVHLTETADILEIVESNKELIPGCTDKKISVSKIKFFEPSFYVAFVRSNSIPETLSFGDRYDSITNLVLIDVCMNKVYVVDEVYEKGQRVFPKNRFGHVKIHQIWDDTVEIHYVVNPKVGIRQKFLEWLFGDGQGYRVKLLKISRF